MTGEMTARDCTPDAYPLHFAIAEAVGGTVRPFDIYQGPYVLIGKDIRLGTEPYCYCPPHMGVVRLWIDDDPDGCIVYNEATGANSPPFWPYGPGAAADACEAARAVLASPAPATEEESSP